MNTHTPDVMTITLSVASLVIGALAFVGDEFRIPLLAAFAIFIAVYYIADTRNRMDKNTEQLHKLNEKVKIHEDLIDIKASIKTLEKQVFKK